MSRWDEAHWNADDALYSALKSDLDRTKSNNIQDALIAETSIKGDYVLVTDDTHEETRRLMLVGC